MEHGESHKDDKEIDDVESTVRKVGDWLLVALPTKRMVRHFVAQIIDFEEGKPICKKKSNQVFT